MVQGAVRSLREAWQRLKQTLSAFRKSHARAYSNTWEHRRRNDLRQGGGTMAQGAKPRVPTNPVFSSDLGHLFFVTALTRLFFFLILFFTKRKWQFTPVCRGVILYLFVGAYAPTILNYVCPHNDENAPTSLLQGCKRPFESTVPFACSNGVLLTVSRSWIAFLITRRPSGRMAHF